jgi:potassium/hydrogen antiporter
MFSIDQYLLVGALLLLVGILSSKFSTRIGLPVLVLFLAIGMLAGEDGIGRIQFDNYPLAHGIGTLALAIILFDGGLRTPMVAIRAAWKPAFLLATLGVLLTAGITGLAASLILGLPILYGLLLGSIVGSTDAAAVFSILRSRGLHLRRRLEATLEIESGSNDPMAVLMTLAIIQAILVGQQAPGSLFLFFIQQMGLGVVVGLLVGRGGAILINRIRLDAAGLYPVLAAVVGILSYAVAAVLGGSGFLSVYVAGIVVGNARTVFQRGTFLFHDGFAWIAQMVMFIVLGLLSTPSALVRVAPQGLLVAAVLIVVARPFAVLAVMLPFRFRAAELAFLSWAGLKGAVPVVLATYPLLLGVPQAMTLFNVVFFVVLISAITQGWTLRLAAEWLGVQGAPRPEPPVALEITSLRNIEGDIVDYVVSSASRAAGRRLRDLALPEGAVVALITRGDEVIPARGSTEIRTGDHAFVVLRPETRSLVDRVFGARLATALEPALPAEFPLQGSTTVADLREFYGIELEADDQATLDQILRQRLGAVPDVGEMVRVGLVCLRIREIINDHIEWVGLSVVEDTPAAPTTGAKDAPDTARIPRS